MDSSKQVSTPKQPPKIESAPVKAWRNENGEVLAVADSKSLEHPINSAMGVKDSELAQKMLLSVINALNPIFGATEDSFNIFIQSEHDFKPKDAVEARLVAQATVAFHHAMEATRKCATAEMLPHLETYGNLAIKFMRVHNETIETLNRYRRGGEQKVTVTHAVLANNAIINNFPGGGGPS